MADVAEEVTKIRTWRAKPGIRDFAWTVPSESLKVFRASDQSPVCVHEGHLAA